MASEIDYAAVLADLEARRAAVDAAIAGVRLLMGQAPAQSVPAETLLAPGVPNARPDLIARGDAQDAQAIAPGTFHGLSVAEAARKFLEMTKKKQRMKDISEALQRGGIESISDNFYGNVFTTMARRKDFVKLGKFWALAEWYPNRPEKPAKKTKKGRKGAKPRVVGAAKTDATAPKEPKQPEP
jgi:hypothetical protein